MLTSLFRFEPGCGSGVSGGGHQDSQRLSLSLGSAHRMRTQPAGLEAGSFNLVNRSGATTVISSVVNDLAVC